MKRGSQRKGVLEGRSFAGLLTSATRVHGRHGRHAKVRRSPSSCRCLGLLLGLICSGFSSQSSQVVTWGLTNNYGLGTIPASLTNAIAVAAGDNHSVALKANGTVVAWGSNLAGQTNVPVNLSNVVAIAAAGQHTLALKSNGTVVAWGRDGTNMPAGLTNVVAIAAAGYHGLALKSDGNLVAWGDFSYSPTNIPAGLGNLVGIAAGGDFSAALKADGTVTAWRRSSLVSTSGMTNVAMIAASEFPLVALKANGTPIGYLTPPPSVTNLVAVAPSRYGVSGLKANGTIVTWGSDTPAPPAGITNVEALASGQYHALAIIGSGPPRIVTPPPPARTVSPGASFPLRAAALGDWPLSYQWQFNGTNIDGATNQILALTNVLPHDSGAYAIVVTNASGSVTGLISSVTVPDFSGALNTTNVDWTTSGNAVWVMETGTTHDGDRAMQSGVITNGESSRLQATVTGPGTLMFWWKISSSAGAQLAFSGPGLMSASISGNVDWQQQTFYLGEGRQVVEWSFTKYSGSAPAGSAWLDEVSFVPGLTAPFFTRAPVGLSQAPGFSATLSGTVNGTPPITTSWQFNGTNVPGASGTTLAITNLQATTAGLYRLVATNAGGVSSADVTLELGPIAAWGDNSYGQINVPAGMSNTVAIAANKLHNLALKADGTAIAWGDNSYGAAAVPAGLSNVIAVAGSAGSEFSLVLKDDGAVAMWGDNTFNQTDVPTGLTNVIAIAAGHYHSLSLKADGTVTAWGFNVDGQTSVPAGLSNVVRIAAGRFHSLALTADGTVIAWGRPTVVPEGLSNVVAIAAGYFCAAVQEDGTLVAWDAYFPGQIDQPPDLTNVLSVDAGWYHGVVLRYDGSIAAVDTNSSVPVIVTNAIAVGVGLFHNLALESTGPPALQVPALNPAMTANGFEVAVPTQSGKVYRLEYTDSLSAPNWTAMPLVAGTGGLVTLTDTSPPFVERFYRVRRW